MDFIDWCQHILMILEREKSNIYFYEDELQETLFGDFVRQNDFWESARPGMLNTLETLEAAQLIDSKSGRNKITSMGRSVLQDPTEFWTKICEQKLDEEEQKLLFIANKLSVKQSTNPNYASLEFVESEDILKELGIAPPLYQPGENIDDLSKYVYALPERLSDMKLLKCVLGGGLHSDIKSTYEGLVWETRRGFTIQSKFIDGLLEEWETTTVDFKQEINLDTEKQKGDFAKDVLGLANTKSSGQRYLIIGFDDKTRKYYAPPSTKITQNRMEQILSNLTEPTVTIRYEVVDYRLGKVGQLEVIREPENLPYLPTQDVFDEKRRKRLEKDKIYVRHGSQTEEATTAEEKALKDEGQRARGEQRV